MSSINGWCFNNRYFYFFWLFFFKSWWYTYWLSCVFYKWFGVTAIDICVIEITSFSWNTS